MFEELEPRLLFSADVSAAAFSASATDVAESLWIATVDDVSGSLPGDDAWSRGVAVRLGDPGLAVEPGASGGSFSVAFDLGAFAPGAEIDALHWVGADLQLGASGFALRRGDLLLSTEGDTALASTPAATDAGFASSLGVDESDVFVFRPDVPGDYAGQGSFALLLDDPLGGVELTALTLVEQDTAFGDVLLGAGDFLLAARSGIDDRDLWLYEPADVGPTPTGTASLLLDGEQAGLSIDAAIQGVELLERATRLGTRDLDAGTLLLAVASPDAVGANGVAATEFDLFALVVARTTLGSGAGNEDTTATLLFEGADVGLDDAGGELSALALVPVPPPPPNQAPLLIPSSPALPPIHEDDAAAAGVPISALLGSVSDADAGAELGIALTGSSSGNGSFEYSLDGGASFVPVGVVSTANALLLRSEDRIRFVPDGENADAAGFQFRAWDRTSGAAGASADASVNGGSTAFSADEDTASIAVTALNDAPLLVPAAPTGTLSEDNRSSFGSSIASLLGASVSDVDLGAVEGVAITGLSSGRGVWQYQLPGSGGWVGVGAVADDHALLLRSSDRLRFVPDGLNADAASVTYRAWDWTAGTFGTRVDATLNGATTALSTATDTYSLTVVAANDAPALTPLAPVFAGIDEDDVASPGQSVASLLGSSVSDVDTGAVEGIAVTGLVSGNGTWQFSTDAGASWNALGAVADDDAILLRDTDRLRFVPDAQNADAASITYRAWDRSDGSVAGTRIDASANGGTTAFSAATGTASLSVAAVNDAPLLVPAAPSFTVLGEDDAANPGDDVAALLGGSASDVDAGAAPGIAVTGLASGNGTWQFSTDSGGSWHAVGAVSDSNALLLRDIDRLRFVPDGRNADAASVGWRAWDRSSGSAGGRADASAGGGASAFSSAADTAAVAVAAVNDAPRLGDAFLPANGDGSADPDGDTLASLFAALFADVDAGAQLAGVVVVENGASAASEGVWEYASDAAASWFPIGAVGDDATALALHISSRVRFVPVAGFGTAPAPLRVRALDDAYAGAFSTTAPATELRASVDASANGGAASIAGQASRLSTSLAPPPAPPTQPDPPPPSVPDTGAGPAAPAGPGGTDSASGPAAAPPPADPEPEREHAASPAAGDEAGSAPAPQDSGGGGGGEDAHAAILAELTDARARRAGAPRALPELGERLRNLLAPGPAAASAASLASRIFLDERAAFLQDLDGMRRDLDAPLALELRAFASAFTLGTGLTVGYVLWLTRGGLLLASLVSSLPAWRAVDPLPVLARLGDRDEPEDADAESLASLLREDTRAPRPRDASDQESQEDARCGS